MIDIENEVFTEIANAVEEQVSGVSITSEYVKSPPSFPHISAVEVDNSVYARTRSSTQTENHAQVLYEINVYSNRKNGKKAECRRLMDIVDGRMLRMGFTRVTMSVVPDMYDATIYRMLARYQAVVSTNHTIYRA